MSEQSEADGGVIAISDEPDDDEIIVRSSRLVSSTSAKRSAVWAYFSDNEDKARKQ